MRIVLSSDGSVVLSRGERITRGQDLSRRIYVEWNENESPIESGPKIKAENLMVQVCITRPDDELSGWYIMLPEPNTSCKYYYPLTAWDTLVSGTATLQIRWFDMTLATLDNCETCGAQIVTEASRSIFTSQEATFIIDNGKIAQPVNVSSENYDEFLKRAIEALVKTNDGLDEVNKRMDNLNDGLDEVNKRMDNLEEDFDYKAISIPSFSVSPSVAEKGAIVETVDLRWSVNKTPEQLTLNDSTIAANLTSKTLTGLSLTNNKTYTLKATDERGATATANAYVRFYNGVYYGVMKQDLSIYDDEDISSIICQNFTKNLQSTKDCKFNVKAGEGQYIYFCLPTSYGTPTFTVNGFNGGFYKFLTIQLTNSSEYTESYDIYRSDNAKLGDTTVEVR